MAELTFKSPGVSTREIDLSGPTALGPQGTPAGIIGTALKGRAFVPITVATFQDFVAEFGATDGEKFGPLAMNEWMRNARAGTYVRVLGVGDGAQRNSATGIVTNAGFVVGDRLVKDNGLIGSARDTLLTLAGANPFANVTDADAGDFDKEADRPQPLGRMNFLGALMKDVDSSGLLVDSGAQATATASAVLRVHVDAGNSNIGGGNVARGQVISLTAVRGGAQKTVKFIISDTGHETAGVDTGVKIAAAEDAIGGGDTAGAGNVGAVAVGLALNGAAGAVTGHAFLVQLRNAIIDTDAFGPVGSADGIRFLNAAITGAEDGNPAFLEITQHVGAGGNTSVTETLGGAINFKTGGGAAVSPVAFSGGSGGAGAPILRAAIMTADGVVMTLSSSFASSNAPTAHAANTNAGVIQKAGLGGASHGTVDMANGKQGFEILLNGHKNTALHPNKIKASLDPADPSYISKVLNTDPTKIREAGHFLYAHYDVYPAIASPTAINVDVPGHAGTSLEEAVFVLVGEKGRNAGDGDQANYEDFQERFQTAKSPYFISQDFGAGNKNLFRICALDDGASANDLFKITIENIAASSNENNKFGKFDVVIRDFYDTDSDPRVLESYRGVTLDRSSDNYIARRIGDQYAYYDFDQRSGAQKLRIEGAFTNRSRYVRVEMTTDVTRGALPDESIPVGFRGHGHLFLDGANSLTSIVGDDGFEAASGVVKGEVKRVKMPPIPLRVNLSQGLESKRRANADLAWGVQFERVDSVKERNRNSVVDTSLESFTKYFPSHRKDIQNAFVRDNAGAAEVDGAVVDCDLYNHNMFTLERIQVSTGSNDRPIVNRWEAAVYRRAGEAIPTGATDTHDLTLADGTVVDADSTRYLDPAKDFSHLPTRKYLKFTTFVQGGFDGFNIFDKEKSKLSDSAARREFGEAANQGGVKGPTIAAYRKAIDVMEEKADVEIQLLAIPGIRHPSVTDFAIDSVETRFDAMLIMDIEEKDQNNEFVTGSNKQLTNVTYTVNNFESRNLDSSFAAAYFPDVVITDPNTGGNVKCPPSVAVLGAFSLNDSVSHPWFAPAGFTRGALNTVLESQVKLKRANLDALYEADINPITSFPHTPGVVVFGQKTLQAAQSALDRVNVRRLLIDIRRRVKKIANSLLFEPNRVDTLARFSNLVNPVLQQIQTQQGLDRYKVQIDTSTTTQADVENNTIRGKIFLQPTRSLEFISLDFVVTNQGAEI